MVDLWPWETHTGRSEGWETARGQQLGQLCVKLLTNICFSNVV